MTLSELKMALRNRSLLVPLAIVVAGPAVLAVMWGTLDWPKGVNGFPAFRSGSVGDAVLLPTVVGSLLYLIDRCRPADRERHWMVIIGAVGAAIGILVQWLWWSDPAPPTQWGLAGPRNFTIAGWWHAGFFVAMATMLAVWGIQMLVRVRGELQRDNTAPLTTQAFTLMMTALLTFCGLLTLDSRPTASSQSSTSSLGALAIALALLLILGAFMWGRKASTALGSILTSAIGAAAAVASCLAWPPAIWQMVLFSVAVFAPSLIYDRISTALRERTQVQTDTRTSEPL